MKLASRAISQQRFANMKIVIINIVVVVAVVAVVAVVIVTITIIITPGLDTKARAQLQRQGLLG